MSYLLDFVRTFNEDEWVAFRRLDLLGKEELVRDAYLNCITNKKFDERSLPVQLGLTQSHFDKINSVLLDKTIYQFYGNDYQLALRSILKKGLSQLMLHELKIIERRVLKTCTPKQEVAFYLAAFESLRNMFHPNYDPKLTKAYGEKYLKSLKEERNISQDAYVAFSMHQANMLAQSVASNETGYRPEARRVLDNWHKKLQKVKDKEPWFHYYFTCSTFVKYYGSEVDEFINALLQCAGLLNELPADLRNAFEFRVYCELGFGYIEQQDFSLAEKYYAKAFGLPQAKTEARTYQVGCFFNLCLISGNYSKAQFLFEEFLQQQLLPGVNRSLQFDVLVNAFTLSLHVKQFDLAFDYLQQLKGYKKHEFTRMGNAIVRVCEALYFYCSGDYALAEVLTAKHIKFLRKPENRIEQLDYYFHLLHCILLFSKQRGKGLKLNDSMQQKKQALRGGLYNIFNRLL